MIQGQRSNSPELEEGPHDHKQPQPKQTVLVTGATGYLGSKLLSKLSNERWNLLRGRRDPPPNDEQNWLTYGDLGTKPIRPEQLNGVDIVVHFAGKAHVEPRHEAIEEARISNVEGTRQLASASAEAGVKRFIFVSSATVLEGSVNARGWIDDDSSPNPKSPYGQMKSEAEEILRDIADRAAMEWVIVRPPMVYGPGAPGNLRRLIQLVSTRLPLPLATATAPKSFVYVGNLVSALKVLLDHPAAHHHTLLVADAETLSTADLIRSIAAYRGQKARLFPLPRKLLGVLAGLANRENDIDRLFKPLALDASRVKALTGWQPPYTAQEGLAETLRKS